MKRVLVAASSGVLAVHLAARCAAAGCEVLLLRTRPQAWAGHLEGTVKEVIASEVDAVDEIWCLATGSDPIPGRGRRIDRENVDALLPLVRRAAGGFSFVGPSGDLATAAERECAAAGVRFRRLEVGLVAAAVPSRISVREGGLHQLARAVLAVRDEVADRSPEYWQHFPLRFVAAADDAVAVSDAADAARALIAAGWDETPDVVAAARLLPVARLATLVSAATGVRLDLVTDPALLTPVDRLFAHRLGVLPLVRQRQPEDDAHAEKLACAVIEATDSSMARWEQVTDDRPSFVDTASGTAGPPLVVVNAFGVGAQFWHRLMERMGPRRVVIWPSLAGRPGDRAAAPLDRHVADLIAALDGAGIGRCHLAGWCSGGYVAVEAAAELGDRLASLTLFNSSVKRPGDGDELDTPFQRGVTAMCLAVRARPELLPTFLKSFGRAAPEPEPKVDWEALADPADAARLVLSTVDPGLQREIRRSMRDPILLEQEIDRIVGFREVDPLARAAEISAPVLCLAGEYDDVVSPAAARLTAARLPGARFAEVVAGTHFLMHDRADAIAEVLDAFFADPGRLDEAPREVIWQAPGSART